VSRAFRCQVCEGPYTWRIDRRGDAVVSWADDAHLAEVCVSLQRDWETTELVVTQPDRARRERAGQPKPPPPRDEPGHWVFRGRDQLGQDVWSWQRARQTGDET
jgi:hypothetical protein